MEHLKIHNGDIALDVRVTGPQWGDVVVLLHGFPECWNTWRHQMPLLAEAGYRVYAPDMRGYGKSSKPRKHQRYALDELITDIEAIRRHSGQDRIHLVGHDWGAAVAWWYAIHHESALHSLSILNVPHPVAFLNTLKSSPLQMLKSWYIFFFQIPWLPEWLISLNDYALFKATLKKTSMPGAYTQEDMIHLTDTWRQPGCLRGMVNYYRAMLRNIRIPENEGRLTIPTRILWGEKDIALTLSMARDSLNYLTHGELKTYPEATHWLAHDKPQEVAAQLIDHFRQNTPNLAQENELVTDCSA